MKFRTIVYDTLLECLGKKILLVYFGISTLFLLVLAFVFNVDITSGRAVVSAVFGSEQAVLALGSFQNKMLAVQGVFAVVLYTVGLYFAVFATADLIPGMMAKGRLELYLSRPVSRAMLLLGKGTGATLVIAANVIYVMVGVWLIVGIKVGIWNGQLFCAGGSIMLMFGVLFTIMMLVGILTGNTAVTIIVTYAVIACSPVLAQRDTIGIFVDSNLLRTAMDVLYWVLPKYFEITKETYNLAAGAEPSTWIPFISTVLTGLAVLQGTIYLFSRKDV